jgi:hypothetical protein
MKKIHFSFKCHYLKLEDKIYFSFFTIWDDKIHISSTKETATVGRYLERMMYHLILEIRDIN